MSSSFSHYASFLADGAANANDQGFEETQVAMMLPRGSEILTVEMKTGQNKRFQAYWEHGYGTVSYRVALSSRRGGACVLFNIPTDLDKVDKPVINLDSLMFDPKCCTPDLVRGESAYMLKAACKRVWDVVRHVYPRLHGIDLQDDSEIDCIDVNGIERKIKLSNMYGLVYGTTWYGSMGAKTESPMIAKVLEAMKVMGDKVIATTPNDLEHKLRSGGHPFLPAERRAVMTAYTKVVNDNKNAVVTTSQLLKEIKSWDSKRGQQTNAEYPVAARDVQGCWLLNRLGRFLINAYPELIRSLEGSVWIFEKNVVESWPSPKVDDLLGQTGGGGRSVQVYRQMQTRIKNKVDATFKNIARSRAGLLSA